MVNVKKIAIVLLAVLLVGTLTAASVSAGGDGFRRGCDGFRGCGLGLGCGGFGGCDGFRGCDGFGGCGCGGFGGCGFGSRTVIASSTCGFDGFGRGCW
jgi:hypothetical protein